MKYKFEKNEYGCVVGTPLEPRRTARVGAYVYLTDDNTEAIEAAKLHVAKQVGEMVTRAILQADEFIVHDKNYYLSPPPGIDCVYDPGFEMTIGAKLDIVAEEGAPLYKAINNYLNVLGEGDPK